MREREYEKERMCERERGGRRGEGGWKGDAHTIFGQCGYMIMNTK